MAKGIIGEPFTFTVLFLGDDGEPFTPNPEPTIEVFYFCLLYTSPSPRDS